MPALKQSIADSLPEYLKFVEDNQSKTNTSLWFRGCSTIKYDLIPTLYRHPHLKTPEQLVDVERKLITRFKQRSIPYHARSLSDIWDTLFFMQHHGVPTRLLDWTENPLVALHFALIDCEFLISSSGKTSYASDAAIWMLNPASWNRHALRHLSYDSGVLSPDDDVLKSYTVAQNFSGMHNLPLALYGAHNSTRIVAQQGVFTIFGKDLVPMNKSFTKERFPQDCLKKIVIRKTSIAAMRKSLLNHGITESAVFPDLDGLSKEIKRVFGFSR